MTYANTIQINAKFPLVAHFNIITAQLAIKWPGFGLNRLVQ